MLVLFNEIKNRYLKTNKADFTVTVLEENKPKKQILCRGMIPHYPPNIPLEIQIDKQIGKLLFISKFKLSTKSESLNWYLRYCIPDITDGQIKQIQKVITYDIKNFISDPSAKLTLVNALKGNKNANKYACIIFDTLKQLFKEEVLYQVLQETNLSNAKIEEILDKYPYDQIIHNPFVLINDGLDFEIIDKWTYKGNLYTLERIIGAVEASFYWSLNKGDTCVEFNHFLKNTNTLLKYKGIKESSINKELLLLGIYKSKHLKLYVLNNKLYIYSNNTKTEEEICTEKIKLLLKGNQHHIPKETLKDVIGKIQIKDNIRFNKQQIEAVTTSLKEPISIINGGPGTGKTTIIKCIVDVYKKENPHNNITLITPTGISAKVLSKAVDHPAETIHRKLQIDDSNVPIFNTFNPLTGLIIVDEASMVDLNIMSNLLKGLNKDSQLILVGDANQLPSVKYGNVLQDLIDSGKVKTSNLSENHRSNSNIENIANTLISTHKIIKNKDIFIKECKSPEEILTILSKIHLSDKTQILTTLNQGKLGVSSINRIFKKNKKSTAILNIGDRVVFNRNNYKLGYNNGTQGIIEEITPEKFKVKIKNKYYIEVPLKYEDDIQPAYCITVHKAQGSEVDNVILILQNRFDSINLLYTAITRAKKTITILTLPDVLENIISKDQIRRTSNLAKTI